MPCTPHPNPPLTPAARDLMARLPLREQKILTLRYGLEDGRELTAQMVADTVDLTVAQVKAIEASTLRHLRTLTLPSKAL